MSIPFTPVANWQNSLQDSAGIKEIVNAYNERAEAGGGYSCGYPTDTGDIGDNYGDLWDLQILIEDLCTKFVNHNDLFNTDQSDFNYFTWDTFRAAAGLGDGWRRKVNPEDSFSYGNVQPGDLRASWNFEDLQKALSALRWCSNVGDIGQGEGKSATGYAFGPQNAYGNSVEWYNAASWSAGPCIWDMNVRTWKSGSMYYELQSKNTLGHAEGQIAVLPTRPRSVDLYLIYRSEGDAGWGGTLNLDPEGFGFDQNKLTLKQSWPESLNTIFNDATVFGTYGPVPSDSVGMITWYYSWDRPYFIGTLSSAWLAKWNFTNQNA